MPDSQIFFFFIFNFIIKRKYCKFCLMLNSWLSFDLIYLFFLNTTKNVHYVFNLILHRPVLVMLFVVLCFFHVIP